ncbi:MAG: HNH endonuclease signature motif containing protein [Tetrasphaera sp.]
MSDRPLPEPDSEELATLVGSSMQRMLYGLLYRRRNTNPPTMVELRAFAADALGEDQSQTDRRVRELRRYFEILVQRPDGQPRYVLTGWAVTPAALDALDISLRRRAEVLAAGRCAMCGRTPNDHHVVLVVDHRVPVSWGGTSDPENLQALCEDCNSGKRDYFQTFEKYSEEIRLAANHAEPQRRIGELLKAFEGKWVRGDLIGVVASAKEYQEDWQRRLRDLRFLGWEIEHQNRYDEGARVRAYYRAVTWKELPENIPQAIREETMRRKKEKSG